MRNGYSFFQRYAKVRVPAEFEELELTDDQLLQLRRDCRVLFEPDHHALAGQGSCGTPGWRKSVERSGVKDVDAAQRKEEQRHKAIEKGRPPPELKSHPAAEVKPEHDDKKGKRRAPR